jgi:molybdopterin-guanine dinucleotide biosynthesis protein A
MAADGHGAHPLHAVWDRERLPELRVAASQGERSLAALARISLMATVDLDAPHRHVRERWSVFNVNTPEDLEAARAHAGGDG